MSCSLLDSANRFVGNPNIKWLSDFEGLYAKHPQMPSLSGVNDFKLRFWKDGADIPESIQNAVSRKFETYSVEINMCCYQFCYLACIEAGIITEEQMNKIFNICKALRPETEFHKGSSICAGHAFYNGITAKDYKPFHAEIQGSQHQFINKQTYEELYNANLCDYEDFTGDNATAGDLLLHFRYPSNNPMHYSIYAGNGEVIEHNNNAECRKGRIKIEFDDEVIQIIPQEKIAANICAFIKNHEQFCDLERDRIPDPEFLESLKQSPSYAPLITDFYIFVEDSETGDWEKLDVIPVPIRKGS